MGRALGHCTKRLEQGCYIYFFLHENTKKGGAFPHHKRHTAALVVAPPYTPALPHLRQGFRYPPVMVPYSD